MKKMYWQHIQFVHKCTCSSLDFDKPPTLHSRHFHPRPSFLRLLKPYQLPFSDKLLDNLVYLVQTGGDVYQRDVGDRIVGKLLVLLGQFSDA